MKKFNLLTIFLMTSFLASADVVLDSSNTKPAINEPFTIQVKFLNEDKKDYEIEGIDNFQILSKGSQSKYSYVNGAKSSEKIDTYTVMGNTIANIPLTVKLKGENRDSNTLNIQISKETVENISNEMSLEPSLKTGDSFYFGEKIPYEENFLTTSNINSIGYNRAPKFDNFSEKDMSPVNSSGNYPQSYFRANSGKQGLKINLYQGILEANSSGEKTISSGQVAVTQSTGRRDFFFEESTPPKYFGGKIIKLNILPLPTNKPAGFQNVVGTPKIDYQWNSDTINYGGTVVLNVKISGAVNLDSLEKIVTQQFNDFSIFESIKDSNESILSGKYFAEKEFEIAFVPKKSGDIYTPEITIPYFDTESKSYKNLKIPSHKIVVNGTAPSSVTSINTDDKNAENSIKNTPLPTKSTEEIKISSISNEQSSADNKIKNPLLIALICLVIIEGGAIVYLLSKKNNKNSNSEFSAMKLSKNNKEFYDAYCNFMKTRYNFSPKVHLEDRILKLGIPREFIEINRELENSYYSGEIINKKEIINRIKKVIRNEK